MTLEITRDEEARRFVARLEAGDAHLSWAETEREGVLDYVSTFVPPAERGRGVGSRLVLAALEDARERGVRVVPSCPFVEEVADRHPEYGEVLVRGRG